MTTSIRLAPETEQRLEYLASPDAQRPTTCAKSSSRVSDYCLAADVLERVRKGQEQMHSSADVRRDLGLDN